MGKLWSNNGNVTVQYSTIFSFTNFLYKTRNLCNLKDMIKASLAYELYNLRKCYMNIYITF